ncbi:hypothetical protein [Nocardioides sp. NPDC047086]|uniref:hypothetical protein n=1 Tax=Nocardioides sp. NPDC047086 TaxID=3154810 RepID=UPI0033F5879E
MARPRTPIGTFGEISYSPTASGKVEARTRFRDVDAQLRQVCATGDTRTAAQHALKASIAQRVYRGQGVHDLGPDGLTDLISITGSEAASVMLHQAQADGTLAAPKEVLKLSMEESNYSTVHTRLQPPR